MEPMGCLFFFGLFFNDTHTRMRERRERERERKKAVNGEENYRNFLAKLS